MGKTENDQGFKRNPRTRSMGQTVIVVESDTAPCSTEGFASLPSNSPLSSLKDDVATVKRAIALEGSADHPRWATLTEASSSRKLVMIPKGGTCYIAAFAPDVGQSWVRSARASSRRRWSRGPARRTRLLEAHRGRRDDRLCPGSDPYRKAHPVCGAGANGSGRFWGKRFGGVVENQTELVISLQRPDRAIQPSLERAMAKAINAKTVGDRVKPSRDAGAPRKRQRILSWSGRAVPRDPMSE